MTHFVIKLCFCGVGALLDNWYILPCQERLQHLLYFLFEETAISLDRAVLSYSCNELTQLRLRFKLGEE